jgi:hypothetical protein
MTEPLQSIPSAGPEPRVTDEILRIVTRRLAQRAGEYGYSAGPDADVRLRQYGKSSTYPLYLAEIHAPTGAPQRMVVKFAPVFGQHREGAAEFANLRAMWSRLGPAGALHVPRPLDYWEDVNALITEHRPGRRFSAQILSAPWFASDRARESLARTSAQCGEWLRIYHDTTSRGDGPAIDERFAGIVRRDLARLPSRGALHALRGPIERTLDTLVAMGARTVPVAVRHGDYSPDNVHLDGDGICVFDLSHHLAAPVYDDIAFFLVTLDTMNPYPRYPAFDRRIARALALPFLEGYFGGGAARRDREDATVLAAYTMKNLLTRCLKQRRVAAAAGPFALAAFDGLWVAGHYRRLMQHAMDRVTARG